MMRNKRLSDSRRAAFALLLCVLLFGANSSAQTNAARTNVSEQPQAGSTAAPDATPDVAAKKSSARFKLDVKSQAEFDALARV
jgi:hypothetical protein